MAEQRVLSSLWRAIGFAMANPGSTTFVIVPSHYRARTEFNDLHQRLQPILRSANAAGMFVEFVNNSRLSIRSQNTDIRGHIFDAISIDESAHVDQSVIDAAKVLL